MSRAQDGTKRLDVRLPSALFERLWWSATVDQRSINGQIVYLLAMALRLSDAQGSDDMVHEARSKAL